MINKMDYVQAAALVKMQEKKMLTSSKINRLIEAETAKDVLKQLSETSYSKSMVMMENDEDFDGILKNELKRTFEFARDISKKEQIFIDILELKYEFQDLKQKLKDEIKDNKTVEIEEKYQEYYNVALKEYEKSSDIQTAVIILDKMYFKKLKELISIVDIEILNKYYKILLDSYNIITFLRLKNQKRTYNYARFCLIDDEELIRIYESDTNYQKTLENKFGNKKMWEAYAKTGKISSLERELENSVVSLIKEYKNVNYGVEPVITYIIAKEYEIKAIRLIMIAKINKISSDVIKERVRDIYV